MAKLKKEERFLNKFQAVNLNLDPLVYDRLNNIPDLTGNQTLTLIKKMNLREKLHSLS